MECNRRLVLEVESYQISGGLHLGLGILEDEGEGRGEGRGGAEEPK